MQVLTGVYYATHAVVVQTSLSGFDISMWVATPCTSYHSCADSDGFVAIVLANHNIIA